MEPNLEFDNILKDSVEKGLSTLGESPKQAIFFYIESKYNLPRDKIASKTDVFVQAIEKIFGLGAEFLKALILKTLYERIGLTFEPSEHLEIAFMSSLEKARETFNSNNQAPIIDSRVTL